MPGLSLVCSLVILLVLRVIRSMIWLLKLVLSLEMLSLRKLFFLLNIGCHILNQFLFIPALPCFLLNLSYQSLVCLFLLQSSLLLYHQIWLFFVMSFLTLVTLILTLLVHLVMFLLLFNLLGSLLELEKLLVIFKTIFATWLLHMCLRQFHFLNQMIPLLLLVNSFLCQTFFFP